MKQKVKLLTWKEEVWNFEVADQLQSLLIQVVSKLQRFCGQRQKESMDLGPKTEI